MNWRRSLIGALVLSAVVSGCQPTKQEALGPPRIEAGSMSVQQASLTTPSGFVPFTHTFRVSWTSDGAGAPDSLVMSASGATNTPQRVPNPSNPQAVTFSWPELAPGATLTSTVTAQLFRRKATSSASITYTATAPDIPPPTPRIDTLVVAQETKPATLGLRVHEGVQMLCTFVIFGDNHVAKRAVQSPGCDALYRGLYPDSLRVISAIQQRKADEFWSCRREDFNAGTCPSAFPPGGLLRLSMRE